MKITFATILQGLLIFVLCATTGCGPGPDNSRVAIQVPIDRENDPTAVNLPTPVKALEVGQPFPGVKCDGWIGESFDLQTALASNKPVLIDIWGRW